MKRIVLAAALFIVACSKPQPAAPPAAPVADGMLRGTVVETMNSGGYTYVKLRAGSGEVWAAVQQTEVAVGQSVTLAPQLTLEKFESKTLGRTFDKIVFATIESGVATGFSRSEEKGGLKPAAPQGTQTVAGLLSARASLKDKPVVVRGRVVKFLPQIMGKNWLHLRDAEGDADLTVTTADTAAVGDVVTVRGTLHTDKDFGSGYRYEVIVEEAKVTK